MDTHEESFGYYNLGMELLTKDPFTFFFRMARYKFIWRFLKADDRVLDIATGDGLGAYMLSRKAKTVLGIDRSSAFVKYAQNNFPQNNLLFKVCDIQNSQPDGEWDVICLIGLLEYFDHDQSVEVLEKIHRLMAKGGMLFVGTPNANSQCVATPRRLETHKRELHAAELRELLETFFSRVELYGQNDEFILPSIPEMSFFLMARCLK